LLNDEEKELLKKIKEIEKKHKLKKMAWTNKIKKKVFVEF
jgi:predicted small metal-binding protein